MKAKVIDLGTLDTRKACEQGAVLEVLHPIDRTPIGLKITLAGLDSDIYAKAANKIGAARTNINMTPQAMKRARQGRPAEVMPEDLEAQKEDAINLLASITLSWEGDIVLDGQPLPPCNYDNAAKLYARFPWLRADVDAFVHNRANFLAG